MSDYFNIPDGLVRLEIFPSGNCIFDAFNYAMDLCYPIATLRQTVHDYVKKHYNKFKDVLLEHDNFFENLKKEYIWDAVEGHVVWVALSEIFTVNIFIIDLLSENVINIGEFDDYNRRIIYVEFEKNHYNCYVEADTYQFKYDMMQEQYQDLIAIRNIEDDESIRLAKQIEFEESEKLAKRLQEEENNRNSKQNNLSKVEEIDNDTHLPKDGNFYYEISGVNKIELLNAFNGIENSSLIETEKELIGFAQSQLNDEIEEVK